MYKHKIKTFTNGKSVSCAGFSSLFNTELYEGDIVKYTYIKDNGEKFDKQYSVYYDEDKFQFRLKSRASDFSMPIHALENGIIIGNIYS